MDKNLLSMEKSSNNSKTNNNSNNLWSGPQHSSNNAANGGGQDPFLLSEAKKNNQKKILELKNRIKIFDSLIREKNDELAKLNSFNENIMDILEKIGKAKGQIVLAKGKLNSSSGNRISAANSKLSRALYKIEMLTNKIQKDLIPKIAEARRIISNAKNSYVRTRTGLEEKLHSYESLIS